MFMVFFLHQTTTGYGHQHQDNGLFMVFFLHQTTTKRVTATGSSCCLWSFSYIKPQPCADIALKQYVVYGLFPTSNHNHECTYSDRRALFMVFFLHQTTTYPMRNRSAKCCLWSFSYIKPQRMAFMLLCFSAFKAVCAYTKWRCRLIF